MFIIWILNPENYRIPSRNRLLCQTTKQPFSNFEIQKPCNYQQLWWLKPDPSAYKKLSVVLTCTFYNNWYYNELFSWSKIRKLNRRILFNLYFFWKVVYTKFAKKIIKYQNIRNKSFLWAKNGQNNSMRTQKNI